MAQCTDWHISSIFGGKISFTNILSRQVYSSLAHVLSRCSLQLTYSLSWWAPLVLWGSACVLEGQAS